jgi:hypothetical protein
MPRIHDSYLDCVLYLYKSRDQAIRGERRGGTGFLVGILSEVNPNVVFIYAVTNRHVVQNGSLFIRLNTQDGATDVLESAIGHWQFSADQDIAVAPIRMANNHRFKFVPTSRFLTKQILIDERIGPGDDVFLVGRFMNHEGRQCNTPTVRFGHLSMMPLDPVGHSSNQSHSQESFLADVHAIAGYSGSPVFLCVRVIDIDGNNIRVGPKSSLDPWLLGVEWRYLNQDDPEWGPVARGVRENSGMTAIVPAWRLHDLLHIPELAAVREAEETKLREELARRGANLITSPCRCPSACALELNRPAIAPLGQSWPRAGPAAPHKFGPCLALCS